LVLPIVAALAILAVAPPVDAQPALGARQEFTVGTGGWAGGTALSNPGTGGRLGAQDGFMQLSAALLGNFGQNCRFCTEYVGDWNFEGITQVRLWLNDVGADDDFEMHLALGNDVNFWQYDVGFIPPENEWAEFIVDLTDLSNWTQIVGSGILSSALGTVTNILIRHDMAPFMQQPDKTQGDLGIDSILLTNGVVGIGPSPAVSAIRLAAPFPNPARGPVTFALESADTEPVRMQILDVTGRSIRSVELVGGGRGPAHVDVGRSRRCGASCGSRCVPGPGIQPHGCHQPPVYAHSLSARAGMHE
jgi:hypothetical protein